MNPLANGAAPRRRWAAPVIAGAGIGLRSTHIAEVLEHRPPVPWFELLADNHLASGGLIPAQVGAVREHYPLTFHCVGLSLAGCDPLDTGYLRAVKRLMADFEPAWVSEHLCFSRVAGHHYHDLLPIPYTEEALEHVAARIRQVQDFLGQRLLVENVSSYLQFSESTLSEAQFLRALVERADCELLLDINNLFVNAHNHGFDADACLDAMPFERVREIHLAGYEDRGSYLLDAHNARVSPGVWALYQRALRHCGDVPTLIEWDYALPEFAVLQAEAGRAAAILCKNRAGQAL